MSGALGIERIRRFDSDGPRDDKQTPQRISVKRSILKTPERRRTTGLIFCDGRQSVQQGFFCVWGICCSSRGGDDGRSCCSETTSQRGHRCEHLRANDGTNQRSKVKGTFPVMTQNIKLRYEGHPLHLTWGPLRWSGADRVQVRRYSS